MTSENSRIRVYLAGDISRDRWRFLVIEKCLDYPIDFLSPIDDISYSYQALIHAHKVKKVFHWADILKVRRADVIFAYFRKESPSYYSGTSFECGVAFQLNKPIIMVCDMKPSEACKYELVKRFIDPEFYCEILEDGIEKLKELSYEMKFMPETRLKETKISQGG